MGQTWLSPAFLIGERKQLTVLFADIKGSLELFADQDPEDVRKVLDPVLEQMVEAVQSYDGTVNQVMGDGIMALFGAPAALEDHAVRACYAALAMQTTIKRYAETLRGSLGMDAQIRIGLNSGEAVVRSIHNDLNMDYTAVGQTTHLAARMGQLARPGTTLLTADTFGLVEGYMEAKSLGPIPIRGLPAPVAVYELVRPGRARSRLQAALTRRVTQFVGRDHELEQLRGSLDRARTGHGQVVAIVGEPGAGKSRLLWEFIRTHREEGWQVLESSAASYGKGGAYRPITDWLKTYFQLKELDDDAEIGLRVTSKLLGLHESFGRMLPEFLTLLDVAVDDPAWAVLDPRQRRVRITDALRRLFVHESQRQPVCLAIDDLHRIGAESQAVLDGLVDSLPAVPLLLVVSYRPEFEHGWETRSYYTRLGLGPLSAQDAGRMLEDLLGEAPGLAALKATLIRESDGNPFFLEENIRTLVESQALIGHRGAYRLAKPVQTLKVPPRVRALLAARIDGLRLEEKRLVETASAIGKDVPLDLLAAVTGLPDDELRRLLARLSGGEFLYEARVFPEVEYSFRHVLTHDVVYGSLVHDRRRALHVGIVTAMERLYSDRLADHAERLAHHALEGELWDKAVTYFRQAAARAASRSAYQESVISLERALAALPRMPSNLETLALGIDLRLELRHAMRALRQFAPTLSLAVCALSEPSLYSPTCAHRPSGSLSA